MQSKKILIVGEVFVDTHLDMNALVRLGGIFHSARALSAINSSYSLAYYAPDYLENDINHFSKILNAKSCHKIGKVNNTPNVMLISESKEIAEQGYVNLLKDQANLGETTDILEIVEQVQPTDILINPGRYDVKKILNNLESFEGQIHIDFHYNSEGILDTYTGSIETAILSTSSQLFKKQCKESFDGVLDYFKKNSVNKFLIKENRGGSFYYTAFNKTINEAPAYYVRTMHSVGIGYVWVTKYRGKYYCANRCPDYQRQLYEWYAARWCVECVFRFLKSELKLQDYQAFNFNQHYNHIGYCFLAFGLLQASFPNLNVYEAKKRIESMYVTKSVSLKQEVFQLCA